MTIVGGAGPRPGSDCAWRPGNLRAAGLAALVCLSGCGEAPPPGDPGDGSRDSAGRAPDAVDVADAIRAERAELDATVYAEEEEAQRHEEVFIRLWDDLRIGDPIAVLKRFAFDRIELGSAAPVPGPDHGVPGIRVAALGEPVRSLDQAGFGALLDSLSGDGWRIRQTEWHHSRFRAARDDAPAASTVAFEIHATHQGESHRMILRGNLEVEWRREGETDGSSPPVPAVIRGADLRLIGRNGGPMFSERLVFDPRRDLAGRFPRCSPILLRDLDGDDLTDVVLGGCNIVLRNRGDFQFEPEDFLRHGITRPAEAGILGDFNGDGHDDYVTASLDGGGLLFFAGSAGGRFDEPPVPCMEGDFTNLHVLTSGDVDRDGDLDLFAGQWKAPYVDGTMPTPFYDARDGFPDFLLVNDGSGNFTDGTAGSGLERNRGRRTFSASLVDVNDDRVLDLVVAADFAGIDLYLGEPGHPGRFREVTAEWIAQPRAFGMSHTLADFDGDGRTDIYLVGMSSTTARRLDAMEASRPGNEEYARMRGPMGFGNRLLIAKAGGGFEQPPLANSAARTGWSWGCVSADFDLDGDTDLYVGNGHLSGESARDYCTHFWRHDLYTGGSQPNAELAAFFNDQIGVKLGREFSWNGFEHNVLFLNEPGTGFLNAAFLLGVAFEFDSRAVACGDLDADGRPDLVVVEYRTATMDQRVHLLRNVFDVPAGRQWVGVRVGAAPGVPAEGAVATVRAGGRTWVRPIVTGDSFTTQHAPEVLFGLGGIETLDSIEVRWPSGQIRRIDAPAAGAYHAADPPADGADAAVPGDDGR